MADVNKTKLADALRATLEAIKPYTQDDEAGRPWLTAAREALKQYDTPLTEMEQRFVEEARGQYNDDDVEIDDEGVVVSVGEFGAFVQAWVFIRNADVEVAEEEGDEDEG